MGENPPVLLKLGADRVEIDQRVAKLVATLNRIPGLSTFSSCGGHKNPTISQTSSGRFEINFEISRDRAGVEALELLTFAVEEMRGWRPRSLTLVAWFNGRELNDGEISFALGGRLSPDKLAAEIEKLLP